MKRSGSKGVNSLTDLEKLVLKIRKDPSLQIPPGRIRVNRILREKYGYHSLVNVQRVLDNIERKGHQI